MPDEEIQVEAPPEEEQEITLEEAGLEIPKEEIQDPGQLEGKREIKEEHKEKSSFEKRIAQTVARLKGAEETIEKLKGKDAENEAVMAEVRKHNQALMDKLEALSNKAIDAVETSRQPEGDPPQIVNIRTALDDLEKRKEEAVDGLRGKEVVQIDREIRKLEKVLDGYEYHKAKQAEDKKLEKEQSKPKAEEPEPDPRLIDFLDGNTWYQKDPFMTGAALEYDKLLASRAEWKGKPDKQRFKKVREDIEARFNAKAEPKPKPQQGAESGIGLQKATSNLGGVKTVKLSALEIASADGMGVSREEYAKQKQFIAEGRTV